MPRIGADRYGANMRSHPRRPVAVVAAIIAALWAFVLLPPQLSVWSGAGAPAWSNALDALPVYDGLRLSLASAGVDDLYAVFGAAASMSFVLTWWATGPTFARLGWNGRVLGWLVLCIAKALESPRSWRWPAAFALVVTTCGSLNGSSVFFVVLAAVLWVPFAVRGPGPPGRRDGL